MSHRHGSATTIIVAGFMAVGLVLLASGAAHAQSPVTPLGSGTQADPYLIIELGHLVWMADNVAASSGHYYSMTANIDASATATWNDTGTDTTVLEGFKPIGTNSFPDTTGFRGVFDGNGHTITGLVMNRPTTNYVGLFGLVGTGGQLRNLGMVGGGSTGVVYVGGLAGDNAGTVSNCYATGTVTASDVVGGLAGNNRGTVSNCYATGAATAKGNPHVGGLVGDNANGTVSNSYWDTQTSGLSTSAGGTSKTTAEMKQQATFAGWDFVTIWNIADGVTYPYLRSSPPPFKLSVNVSGSGSVTIDPASADGTYAPGTVITLMATPSTANDLFFRWVGAGPNNSATATVIMDIHRSLTAVFGPRIEISTLADLAKIGNDPAYPLSDVLYVLMADIDASTTAAWNDAGTDTIVLEGFKPIGTSSIPFSGIFEGNGHTIAGLVINRPSLLGVGLFSVVGQRGRVRNLGMVGGAVTGHDLVGGLVGRNLCTVSNCYATGTVTGNHYVGGLVGDNYSGTVSNCYGTGTVTGIETGGYVGGLVGTNYVGTVSDCYATGTVTGDYYVGGLVGVNSSRGTVSNCYATGAITGSNSAGGLVGDNFGTVSSCYATGTVTGNYYVGGLVGDNLGPVSGCYGIGTVTGNEFVGGLVGRNDSGPVSNCYATGAVTGYSFLGGLVGDNYAGTVSNCYATGTVTGTDSVGGLVGWSSGMVSNCYAVGAVSGDTATGGLVGYTYPGSTVSNSYWDTQTSGRSTSAGGQGKTTAQMKLQATFVGWDFATIWIIRESTTYPILRSMPADSDSDGIPDLQDNCPYASNAQQQDEDGDGVGDGCDACLGTLAGVSVNANGCSIPIPGDLDHDGDVDQADFGRLQACLTGSSVIQNDPACQDARLNGDEYVDNADIAIFQRCLTGPNVLADPNCANTTP